ncbi:MAG: endolytic transglycosylase MltG [Bacteroidetes bacterium]|nr:endolytic transglycosylase MltG [Bacteroidota bacterium]
MNDNIKGFSWLKALLIFGIILIFVAAFLSYKAYTIFYKSNVNLKGEKSTSIYIPTNSKFDDVTEILNKKEIIINVSSLKWLAEYKNYIKNVKPGKYKISAGMNNNDLLNMLKSGRQEPVKLVFNNVRTKYQLAGKISKQLEADSLSIIKLLNDSNYLSNYDFTTYNAVVVFIPNTYQFFWNTSASELFKRMNKEYEAFWNKERKSKAEEIGLNPAQVTILASIVQEETNKYDEMPIVAGLYINRLKKDMKLEADPTVKFAIGDFGLKRILKSHLKIDSPYNTYLNHGLPPGPISLPNSKIIDKTLNYTKHHYIYMCAKEDFSGYHNFAVTGSEHAANARRYQNALNRLKIK